MVSDSDSVDTDGYFTSFRSDCGLTKGSSSTKKSNPNNLEGLEEEEDIGSVTPTGDGDGADADSNTPIIIPCETLQKEDEDKENKGMDEYELFGKGSTSTTSSCGTVVLRGKQSPLVLLGDKGQLQRVSLNLKNLRNL